jgi:hypothetical protein
MGDARGADCTDDGMASSTQGAIPEEAQDPLI